MRQYEGMRAFINQAELFGSKFSRPSRQFNDQATRISPFQGQVKLVIDHEIIIRN